MFVFIGFGAFIVAVSLLMIVRPDVWIEQSIRYIRQPFMHPADILLCVGVGVGMIAYADTTKFPDALRIFGYMMAAIGVGLVFVPPSLHQRYGVWSTHKMARYFRPAGAGSLLFGLLLIYAAL